MAVRLSSYWPKALLIGFHWNCFTGRAALLVIGFVRAMIVPDASLLFMRAGEDVSFFFRIISGNGFYGFD